MNGLLLIAVNTSHLLLLLKVKLLRIVDANITSSLRCYGKNCCVRHQRLMDTDFTVRENQSHQ